MIRPLRDRVLVKLAELAPSGSGMVQVVRLERQPSTRATVVAVGDEVRDVCVEAHVVVSRLQGIEVGDGTLLLPENAVLATEPDTDGDI